MNLNSLDWLFLYAPIDPVSALVRLVLAMAFGGLIGLERSKHNQAAGFRTYILITLASCLIMESGLFLSGPDLNAGEATRMAAQVVSGIGFLGAGAIMRFGLDVKGLTTAASIWAVSAIGLAVGAGLYLISLTVTLLIFVVLRFLEAFSHRIAPHRGLYTLRVSGKLVYLRKKEIQDLADQFLAVMEKISVSQTAQDGHSTISCHLNVPEGFDPPRFLAALEKLEGWENITLDAVV